MKPGVAIAAVGLVIALIGVAGAINIIPGLTASTLQKGPVGASFTYTTSGMTATVADHSQLPATYSKDVKICKLVKTGTSYHCDYVITKETFTFSFKSLTFSWGTGIPLVTESKTGFAIQHNYTKNGTYNLNETFVYTQEVQENGGWGSGGQFTSVAVGSLVFKDGHGGCVTNCGGSTAQVYPAFNMTASGGPAVEIQDNTTTLNATVTTILFSWGDGLSPVTLHQDGVVFHNYTASGNYTLTETVNWQNLTGVKELADNISTNYTATVSLTNQTTYTNDYSTQAAPQTAQLNLVTMGLIFGGAAMAIFALLPWPLPWRIVGFILVTVAGLVIGFYAGGLGPLGG